MKHLDKGAVKAAPAAGHQTESSKISVAWQLWPTVMTLWAVLQPRLTLQRLNRRLFAGRLGPGALLWCGLIGGMGGLGGSVHAAPLQQTGTLNQAGLVVVHGDGTVVTRCVDFAPAAISGYELLQTSGLDIGVEASGMGASICRLDGQGCSPPGQSCFCQCMSSPCLYWSYWRLLGGEWTYSNLGATSSTVQAGDVDAWVWGEGTIGRDAHNAPPALTFEQICTPPTPTPTATLTAVPTTAPTAVPTSTPTSTPTLTPTATPAALPTLPPAGVPMATATGVVTETAVPPVPTADTAVRGEAGEIAPDGPPQIRIFSVDRAQIDYGERATLVWLVDGARQVQLRHTYGIEEVDSAGSRVVDPPLTERYTLIASNAHGEEEATLQVFVRPTHTTPTPVPLPSALPGTEPTPATEPEPELESEPEASAVLPGEPETEPLEESLPTGRAEDGEAIDATAQPETAGQEELGGVEAAATADGQMNMLTETEADREPDAEPDAEPDVEPDAEGVALLPPLASTTTSTPAPAPELMSAPYPAEAPASAPEASGQPGIETDAETASGAAYMQRLALLTGSALILGAPLLFAFVWALVWTFWRES